MITVERSIAAASFAVLFVFALVVSGLLTNWFRYFPSLEAMFVMAPLLVALLISAVVTRKSFGAGTGRSSAVGSVLISVTAIILTMVFTKEAYGYWFPRVSIADVDRNEEQTLRGQGSTVTYHLELRNPFARGGEVYLVGTMSAMPFRVLLPMDPPSGYAEPDLPSDWVTLSPTMRPDVFSARVTVDPTTTHAFLVDLRERKAVKAP